MKNPLSILKVFIIAVSLLGFYGAVLAKNLPPAQIQSIRNQLSLILNKLESIKSELKSIKDEELPKSSSSNAGTQPFGGFSQFFLSCNCSNGHLITVGPPRGGTFHVKSESTIYQYGEDEGGSWVLGNYYPSRRSECRIHNGHHCVTIPNDGVIQMMGTSR